MNSDYYQSQSLQVRDLRPAPPRPSLWRRLTDFLMMVAVGLMAVCVLFGGLAGTSRALGPNAPLLLGEHFWAVTGFGGFLLGLSWRFLFWDLPGMLWHVLRAHRRNLQYLFILTAGIAVLIFT